MLEMVGLFLKKMCVQQLHVFVPISAFEHSHAPTNQ